MTHYLNEFDPKAAAWLRELMANGLIPTGVVDERSITDVPANDVRGPGQRHFFSGIGGWCEALRLAGWPADRDVWTGSCPCQPYSSAGKRKGFADDRDLWPEFFRLVRECRPGCVVGEQVEGAIRFGWLDRVRDDLEAEGYAVGHAVLGAFSAGAPHIRQRLYWVASKLADPQDDGAPDDGRAGEPDPQRHGATCGVADAGQQPPRAALAGGGVGAGDLAPDRRAEEVGEPGRRGGPGFWDAYALVPCRDGKLRRVPPEAQSGVLTLADGLPAGVDGVRAAGRCRHPLTAAKIEGRAGLLKGAGNAICVPTAAAFIRAFLDAEAGVTA